MRAASITLRARPAGDGFMHTTCLAFLITLGEGCDSPQVYRWGNGGTERLNNFPTSHSIPRTLTQSSWIS